MFTNLALFTLWKCLPEDDVLNHLLCVVGIAKEVPMEDGWSGPRLELCGSFNPCAPGWRRFREYAAFVRTIAVNLSRVTRSGSSSPILLHDTFWCQMVSILGDAPILPLLTTIHFVSKDSHRDIDMGALRLLNPSVQELTIEFYDSVQENHIPIIRDAFASCFSSASNLQSLSFFLPYTPLDLEVLPQSHPHLRYLRVVEAISSHCLTSIASLPELDSLSICVSEPVNIPIQFKNLRSLYITQFELNTDASLIASIDAPRLCKLSIDSAHLDSTSLRTQLRQYLDPLVARFPALTAFEWECWQANWRSSYYGSRDPGTTLAELIEPLLSLRALHDLSLEIDGPIVPYSSTDFRRMAEAWPELETLSLNLVHARDSMAKSAGNDGPIQYANCDSLAFFARHCPRLHTLRISRVCLDSITDIPSLSPPSELEHPMAGRRLRLLQVGRLFCPEAPGWKDGPRRNEVFRDMMKPLFPFAVFHLPVFITSPVVVS